MAMPVIGLLLSAAAVVGAFMIVGTPDENGWIPVMGHLALWNTCHDGIEARCTTVPRPDGGMCSACRRRPMS